MAKRVKAYFASVAEKSHAREVLYVFGAVRRRRRKGRPFPPWDRGMTVEKEVLPGIAFGRACMESSPGQA